VVIKVGVGGSDKLLWDDITNKNAEHSVGFGIGLVLIKCNKNQGVIHEVLISQERAQEVLEPDTGYSDGGVMGLRRESEIAR
jgi:hypothetical protein